MKAVEVLIVDDHQMVIDGVKSMLNSNAEFSVTWQATCAEEALLCLESQTPEIILLDINLPDKDGVELCGIIKKKYPTIKIIALTMLNEVSFITRIIKAGASGYLLKNTSKSELINAMKVVTKGDQYLAKEVQEKLVSASFGQKKEAFIPKLTRREKEVLALILEELTTKEIASKLFISVATVETHRLHLLNKFGARNTAGLVKMAVQKGIA